MEDWHSKCTGEMGACMLGNEGLAFTQPHGIINNLSYISLQQALQPFTQVFRVQSMAHHFKMQPKSGSLSVTLAGWLQVSSPYLRTKYSLLLLAPVSGFTGSFWVLIFEFTWKPFKQSAFSSLVPFASDRQSGSKYQKRNLLLYLSE